MSAPELRRPTSVAEMFERVAHLATPASMQRALAFRPGPGDLLIATYPKSGTTWLQQMVHTLRTHGDLDFARSPRCRGRSWTTMCHAAFPLAAVPARCAPARSGRTAAREQLDAAWHREVGAVLGLPSYAARAALAAQATDVKGVE